MANNAVGLNMKFTADTGGIKKGASETSKLLSQLGRSAESISQSFKSFSEGNNAAAAAQQQLATDIGFLNSAFRTGQVSSDDFAKEMQSLVSAAEKQSKAFSEGAAVTQRLATEEEKHAAELQRLAQLLDVGAISQETYSRAVEKAEAGLAGAVKAERDHATAMSRGAAVSKSVQTQEEKYAETVDDLRTLLKQGAITQDTFTRAMAKAEAGLKDAGKQTDGMTEQLRKMSSQLKTLVAIEFGKILARGFSAAASAIGNFVGEIRASVGELSKLAQISDTSVERFQGLAAAAATVGIQQEKLGDIFKDVKERVGDFLATGGGPMADFFENIAPKVGVTAEQFARLSGPDALQLYVSSLEKAGVSQAEMTFYLEAMSSDLTALLPLLAAGGAGFDDIAERAERLGIVLSADQTAAIKEMNGTLGLVYATFEGIIGQVTGNLAPAVTALAEEFLSFVEGYQGLGEGTGGTALADSISQALFDGGEYLAGLFDSAMEGFSGFGLTLQLVGDTFSTVGAVFMTAIDAIKIVFLSFQNAGIAIGKLFADIGAFFGVEGAKEYSAAAEEMQAATREQVAGLAKGIGDRFVGTDQPAAGGGGVATRAVRKAREEFEQGRTPKVQKAEDEKRKKLEVAQNQQQKLEEDHRKKIQDLQERYTEKSQEMEQDRLDKLAANSQKALQVSDIRSGGIDQVIALATGREDPAVAEARKQLRELQAMRDDLRALRTAQVEIVGAA